MHECLLQVDNETVHIDDPLSFDSLIGQNKRRPLIKSHLIHLLGQ
jgi:hypothetical protein